MISYSFTWEITKNCSFKCNYCTTYNNVFKEYSSREKIDKVLNFFKELSLQNDTNDILVEITGGEPTLHPELYYICEQLSSIDKLRYNLLSNLSAPIDIYNDILNIPNSKLHRLCITYHENHFDLVDFITKYDKIISENKSKNFLLWCLLGINRKSKEVLLDNFSDLLNKHMNLTMKLAPVVYDNEDIFRYKDKKDNKELFHDQYNKKCFCFRTLCYITEDNKLHRCNSNTNTAFKITIDNNFINVFNILKNKYIICKETFCCRNPQRCGIYDHTSHIKDIDNA